MTATLQIAIDARKAKIGSIQFVNSTNKMKRSAKEATVSVNRLERSTKGLGGTARSAVAPLAALFGGIGAVTALRKSITVIRDFEESLKTLQAVARATPEEFEALEVTARKFGATTRFSASEAADGLLFLARAGFDTREAIQALPSTLNLATAGLLDLGEAADVASNILRQFNLSTEETERVVDALVNTANRSNTDVRQLAEAMKFAGPIANKLGQDVELTAAQVGALGNAGIQASMAGTNLRGVMLALVSPSKDAKKSFAELGIDFEDVAFQALSVQEKLTLLAQRGISAGQAADIFGRRNAAAAIILGESAAEIAKLTREMDSNRGAAEKQARAMDDTLAGAARNLRSAMEEAFIAIGDQGFKGVLRSTVTTITNTIRVLVGMQDSIEGNVERAVALASAFKIIVGILGLIIATKAVIFFGGLALKIAAAAKATLALSAGMSPVLVAFAALGVLIAGIEIGRFLSDEFKVVRVAGHATAIFLLEQWENIKFGFEVVVIAMGKAWRDFMNGMRLVASFVVRQIGEAFAELEDLLPETAVAKLGIGGLGKELVSVADGLVNDIKISDKEITDKLTKAFLDRDKNLRAISQSDKKIRADIESEFGGKQRKRGGSVTEGFIEFAKEDGKAALNLLKELNADLNLTSKASAEVDLNFSNTKNRAAEIGLELDLLGKNQEKISEEAKKLEQIFASVGDALTNSIEMAIFEAKKLSDVVNDLGRSISKMVIQQLVTQPAGAGIAGLFGGLFGGPAGGTTGAAGAGPVPGDLNFVGPVQPSAFGNAFNNGRVMAFQSGGVVNGPTLFPMAGGRTGLAGESGPEAILPLARDGRGRLGVRSEDKPTKVVNNNITMNVSTPDAGSFRQSKTQILSDLRSGISSRS